MEKAAAVKSEINVLVGKENSFGNTTHERGVVDAVWDERKAAEKFVVSVSRCWATALKAEKGSSLLHKSINGWHHNFCLIGSAQAAAHWDRFLGELALKARVEVQFSCSCKQDISMDERRLLAAVSAIQHNYIAEAKLILECWLQDCDVADAFHHLIMFSEQLSRVSYELPNYFSDPFSYYLISSGEKSIRTNPVAH